MPAVGDWFKQALKVRSRTFQHSVHTCLHGYLADHQRNTDINHYDVMVVVTASRMKGDGVSPMGGTIA